MILEIKGLHKVLKCGIIVLVYVSKFGTNKLRFSLTGGKGMDKEKTNMKETKKVGIDTKKYRLVE